MKNIVVPYSVHLDLSVWTNDTEHMLLIMDYLEDEFQTDLRRLLFDQSMMVEDIVMNATVHAADAHGAAADSYDGLYSDATIWGIPVEALIIFCVFECCCLAVCIGFVCGYLKGKMSKRQRLKTFSDKLARALHLSASTTTMTKLKPPSPPHKGHDIEDQQQTGLQAQWELRDERSQIIRYRDSYPSLTASPALAGLAFQSVVDALNEDLTRMESPEPPDLPPPTVSSNHASDDTVVSVASVASSASLTSLKCHKPPTAPPSRLTSVQTVSKSEGHEQRQASFATLGFYTTTLPVLISEIDLDSDSNDDLESGDDQQSESEGLYSHTHNGTLSTKRELAGSSIVYANI